jgi:dTDP-4-dehydrorhamnose 3,5-epimerase
MTLKCEGTPLSGVLLLKPWVFEDNRGCFFESFNVEEFRKATQTKFSFVQDNHSCSGYNVLRGLHYQVVKPQGKLVRVVVGSVFDVVVDLRFGSETFGQWFGVELSASDRTQLWVPPGFAHGFIVTTETAEVLYKTTDYWFHEHERCIRWDDPDLSIRWPENMKPVLSSKDARGAYFRDAEKF